FGILANSAESDLKSSKNVTRQQEEVQRLADDAQNYAMLANIFYGAGAACLVSSTVLFFLEGKESGKKSSQNINLIPYEGGVFFSYSSSF
ncbi:MAG: hypothetical protein N3B13_03195, partial [Deltaproteobacteria bacterium]|nr:hypothetical protein [Deltaproteobacteria bacterium]